MRQIIDYAFKYMGVVSRLLGRSSRKLGALSRFHVHRDDSNFTIGYILTQLGEHKTKNHIFYAST